MDAEQADRRMVEPGILNAVVYEVARRTIGNGINDDARITALLRQWLHDRDELARFMPLITIQYHHAMRHDRQYRAVMAIKPVLRRDISGRRMRLRGYSG